MINEETIFDRQLRPIVEREALARPLVAGPLQFAAELRERINPAYAYQMGTESYERRLSAEAIESLLAKITGHEAVRDSLFEVLPECPFYAEIPGHVAGLKQRVADLEQALNTLRDRVQDEYDRIYISGVLGK